jgi:rod shape-determining protein MreC
MGSLLQLLLTRGGAFLVFALLEVGALYLVANFNSAQQAVAAETWSLYANRINERRDRIAGYLSLKNKVRQLEEENSRLMALLPNASYSDSLVVDSIKDDKLRQRFVYLSANIINKSPQSLRNTFVIDRGHIHGVEKGQGVVTDQGVVGIVIQVAAQHARVMAAWHQDFRLSANLRNKNIYGSLVWENTDTRFMSLTAIPEYAAVSYGDTVETTGFSNIFPSGIPLGLVDNIDIKPGDNNYDLRIRLFNDLFTLRHVYVVRDLNKEDLDKLQAPAEE